VFQIDFILKSIQTSQSQVENLERRALLRRVKSISDHSIKSKKRFFERRILEKIDFFDLVPEIVLVKIKQQKIQ